MYVFCWFLQRYRGDDDDDDDDRMDGSDRDTDDDMDDDDDDSDEDVVSNLHILIASLDCNSTLTLYDMYPNLWIKSECMLQFFLLLK